MTTDTLPPSPDAVLARARELRRQLSGNFREAIKSGDQSINQVICSKDGQYLASSDEAGIIRVFDKAGRSSSRNAGPPESGDTRHSCTS